MLTVMTLVTFSLKIKPVHPLQAPQPMWGILGTKKQHPRDTDLMYLCQQRAYDSPEPEGS